MPKRTYEITTDKGTFEIEVDEPKELAASDKTVNLPLVGNVDPVEFGRTAADAAKGYVKGIPGGIAQGAEDLITLPLSVVEGVLGAAQDVTDVAGSKDAKQAALDKLKSAYQSFKGNVSSALDTARRDPEQFGKNVGGSVAEAETLGVLGGEGTKLLPKPAARVVGRTMQTIGGRAGFPMRIAGAHQVLSGNPLGLVTMIAPEGISKGGRALERAGTEEGAAAKMFGGRLLDTEQQVISGKMSPATAMTNIDAMQAELAQELKTAKLPAELKDVQAKQNALNTLRGKIQKASGIRVGGPGPKGPQGPGTPGAGSGGGPSTPPAPKPVIIGGKAFDPNSPTAQKVAQAMAQQSSGQAPTAAPSIRVQGKAAQDLARGVTPAGPTVMPSERRVQEMTGKFGGTAPETPSPAAQPLPPTVQPLPAGAEDVIARQAANAAPVVAKMQAEGQFAGDRTTMPSQPMQVSPTVAQARTEAANFGDFMSRLDKAMEGAPSKSKSRSGQWKNLSDNDAVTASNAYSQGVRDPDTIIQAILDKRKNRQADAIGNYYLDQQLKTQTQE